MSYSYVNGNYRRVTTEIRNGFKRFHSMNTQESHFTVNDDDGTRSEVWQFVSYATDIMQVVHNLEYNTWVVSCNGNPFSYSPGTSRQLSRWIRENRFFPFTVSDVRVAYNECLPITHEVASFSFDFICFDFRSPSAFHNVWR